MRLPVLLALTAWTLANLAMAEPTITYQGQLQDSSGPVSGTFDLEFRLFDAEDGGNQVGSTVEKPDWPVSDGLFQVELDFPARAFDGSQRWLEIEVARQTLRPRQPVTSAPMAIRAFSVPAANLAGDFWRRGGNAGTDPASGDVLGTTDNAPLDMHVGNQRVLRLEPADVPNVIGGWEGNAVGTNVVGATIGGGGCPEGAACANGGPNLVTSSFGTIGGGVSNTAGGFFSTVGGGENNTARSRATVGGGENNTASGLTATVGGGENNTASGLTATVGGGENNTASGSRAMVGGGSSNTASGSRAMVGGGSSNTASGSWAMVPGGSLNEATGDYSLAAGRRAKAAHRGSFVWADSSSIDFSSTEDYQFLARASGGFGINTNQPKGRGLHFKQQPVLPGQASEIGLAIERSGSSSSNWAFYVAGSNNLGFRYNNELMARINASDGQFVALSDATEKSAVEPLGPVLPKLLQLRPSSYLVRAGSKTQTRSIGLLAQDVEPLFPEVVKVDEGLQGISYGQISVINTAAIIELHQVFNQRLNKLETENAELRQLAERNAELEARLAALEAVIVGDRQLSAGTTSSGAAR